MTKVEKLLGIAREQIGIKESPANSNNVKFNTWFYGKPVSGSLYPWCMTFVQWCFAQMGAPLPYLTASCSGLLNWYKKNQPERIVKTPQAGDIVIFDFPGTAYTTDHTGIVERVDGNTLVTIEGNTGTGNDANGGAVMRRSRSKSLAVAYIRPRVLAEDAQPTKQKEGNDMDIDKFIAALTPEQAYKIYAKTVDHMAALPLPVSWDAAGELREAVKLGITDGKRPMAPATRLETAVMVKRAARNG